MEGEKAKGGEIESSSEAEATGSEHSGESEAESGEEPEPGIQPAAAPSLVPSQVVVKKGHSTAAGATKARC